MFLSTEPAAMAAAAGGLQGIGSAVIAGNAAAAAPTMGVVAPAPEPTSALMALSFSTHGGVYQAAAGVAAAWHEMMAAMLGTNAASYEVTEAINTAASM
jgi:PE family